MHDPVRGRIFVENMSNNEFPTPEGSYLYVSTNKYYFKSKQFLPGAARSKHIVRYY